MNLRIAWRNIWRNKKRTYITISSVSFAVILAVFTRSFQEGTYGKMIENAVGSFTGYVQVHQKDYWEDKTLDNGIDINDTLLQQIKSTSNVDGVNLRLESFSLASFKQKSKVTMVMGIEPDLENKMLKLESKIVNGEYLNKNDSSIIVGSRFAKFMKINVGDTLVLMGQGHWGQSAIGAYHIKGIVKMPSPEIDRQIVFMPIKLAQEYFTYPNGITSIVVKFKDTDDIHNITNELSSRIDTSRYAAIKWQDMTPELVQIIEGDKAGGIVMIAILYMIIAFGVFGTVLMMTEERKKEFAVMVAIGTQKNKLILITLYETVMINMLAVIFGILNAIPLIIYFMYNPITMEGEMAESMEALGVEPILPTVMELGIFINQTIVILFIVAIASLYPVFSILRLKVIKSMQK